jgi:hypothetical protein
VDTHQELLDLLTLRHAESIESQQQLADKALEMLDDSVRLVEEKLRAKYASWARVAKMEGPCSTCYEILEAAKKRQLNSTCTICFTNESTIATLPCGHPVRYFFYKHNFLYFNYLVLRRLLTAVVRRREEKLLPPLQRHPPRNS